MRLFSVKEAKDKSEEKARKAQLDLLKTASSHAEMIRQLNSLREEIEQEKKSRKGAIEEAIAPLLREKAELERALAAAEGRKREMWLPFKGERNRLSDRERDVSQKESELAEKYETLKKKEAVLIRSIKTNEKATKQARLWRDEYRRQNAMLLSRERRITLSEDTLKDLLRQAQQEMKTIFKEKQRFEKERLDFTMNIEAQKKLIADLDLKVRKAAEQVRQDRDKLKVAISIAKKRYGVDPKRFKQQ